MPRPASGDRYGSARSVPSFGPARASPYCQFRPGRALALLECVGPQSCASHTRSGLDAIVTFLPETVTGRNCQTSQLSQSFGRQSGLARRHHWSAIEVEVVTAPGNGANADVPGSLPPLQDYMVRVYRKNKSNSNLASDGGPGLVPYYSVVGASCRPTKPGPARSPFVLAGGPATCP